MCHRVIVPQVDVPQGLWVNVSLCKCATAANTQVIGNFWGVLSHITPKQCSVPQLAGYLGL